MFVMPGILARMAGTVKRAVALILSVYQSPLGPLAIAARDDVLVAIHLDGDLTTLSSSLSAAEAISDGLLAAPIREGLDAYFAGQLDAIDHLAADPIGTAFQRRVWTALRNIPAGTTLSYGALAARIEHPAAVRAVGAANARNPVPIVIPCHRVIGANGSLVGYGGGLDRKRWLLAHEGLIPGRLW